MKKRILVFIALICIPVFASAMVISPKVYGYCPIDGTQLVDHTEFHYSNPDNSPSKHIVTTISYTKCTTCSYNTKGAATYQDLEVSHYFPLTPSYLYTYSPSTAGMHLKHATERFTCSQCHYTKNGSSSTSHEPHQSTASYTETCSGGTHRFYSYCTKCGVSYVAYSAPCDGNNHPSYHINKTPTNQVNN